MSLQTCMHIQHKIQMLVTKQFWVPLTSIALFLFFYPYGKAFGDQQSSKYICMYSTEKKVLLLISGWTIHLMQMAD